MGWNEPEKGKDPWSGKNQPPDLDEALKRIQEKLKKTFLEAQANQTIIRQAVPVAVCLL